MALPEVAGEVVAGSGDIAWVTAGQDGFLPLGFPIARHEHRGPGYRERFRHLRGDVLYGGGPLVCSAICESGWHGSEADAASSPGACADQGFWPH